MAQPAAIQGDPGPGRQVALIMPRVRAEVRDQRASVRLAWRSLASI